MTMQIMMHNQHGLVFAGDTKQYFEVSNGQWTRRRSFNGPKVTLNDAKDIFIARARNMEYGKVISDALLKGLEGATASEWPRIIGDVSDRLAKADPRGFEFLVAFANPATFYHLIIQPDAIVRCFGARDNAIAGDSSNPACFISERCFSKVCSVEQMVNIGAQVVRMAARFSNGTIDGLEIVTISDGRFKEWDDTEIFELEIETKRRLDSIESIVLSGA